MAQITSIENFSKSIKDTFSDFITDNIIVVDDNDLSLFSKDINTRKKALLVAVLPSFRPASPDADTLQLDSLDSFMFLQEKDNKGGYPDFINKMKYTEALGIKFIKHLQEIATQQIAPPEGYLDIEFPSLSLEPVSNQKGFCGYSIDFTTKNIL